MESRNASVCGALFREIHKNTWLKRLTAEGRKITVGNKKSDRSWVVFCVHDDTEALLEGYAEPRMAASHSPEWVVSLQRTQHISHALVPNEQEYEFVVTLSDEVIRFHAISWEIMQEWVDTLRSKLREMKILSPKENLYTKLPEIRAPLLPTRDPTSPLPATPPVPAALVPGVERIVLSSTNSPSTTSISNTTQNDTVPTNSISRNLNDTNFSSDTETSTISTTTVTTVQSTNLTSISNNILNIISNTINDNVNEITLASSATTNSNDQAIGSTTTNSSSIDLCHSPPKVSRCGILNRDELPSLARTFANNVLSDPNTCPTSSHSLILRSNSVTTCTSNNDEHSIRVDVSNSFRHGATGSIATDLNTVSEPTSPSYLNSESSQSISKSRPQTLRSLSVSEPPSSSLQTFSLLNKDENNITELDIDPSNESMTNITIIQVSNPLPSNNAPEVFKFPSVHNLNAHEEYKSNVQIIPSNSSANSATTSINNQYSSPQKIKKMNFTTSETSKVTTVLVTGNSLNNSYGKISSSNSPITSKGLKKVILSTNTSGITNISVGNEVTQSPPHYEKVFLSSSSPIAVPSTSQVVMPPTTSLLSQSKVVVKSPHKSTSQSDTTNSVNPIRLRNKNTIEVSQTNEILNASSSSPISDSRKSPAVSRRRNHISEIGRENMPPPITTNRPALTRGLTEAVITARPSRIDTKKSKIRSQNNNNNSESQNTDRTRSESLEQRRRSSSTSDAQRSRQINGENSRNRIQQPPQPFRLAQENIGHASKRLTLREQQVLQLRREIMHPGGVRLQLRRKDCLGSIAWVDAFGAVWISGWKQKDHPMLYNALHIGDQLISIAGITINTAADANKIIRNTNTLFLEILIRRVPLGRVYAIRRELEGQCLGLIRDGNTATIVDVVPNSLAARHGLPPKAQSCDGLSLTFWVLTEINGRPLNLFFKENEVRDRLNSVGRDISILVQPSDLVAKLKKQLKSLRSHKDYIVQ